MPDPAPLCVVLITYVAPLEAVDAQMKAHVGWLKQALAADLLILAGRRHPRTGGVLIVRGDAERVQALAETDPFVTSGVAEIEVIPFGASFVHPALADLIG